VYEIYPLILSEENRLMGLENRVLRRIFEPKKGELSVNWRKVHNEDITYLYSAPNIILMMNSRRRR
jgi:hypothetical protein